MLADKRCTACDANTPPLGKEEVSRLKKEIDDRWKLVDNHHLLRGFIFPDFKGALEFTNKVGNIAEKENHHPIICLTYGKATVTLYTHKTQGLHTNDFILASKIDMIASV